MIIYRSCLYMFINHRNTFSETEDLLYACRNRVLDIYDDFFVCVCSDGRLSLLLHEYINKLFSLCVRIFFVFRCMKVYQVVSYVREEQQVFELRQRDLLHLQCCDYVVKWRYAFAVDAILSKLSHLGALIQNDLIGIDRICNAALSCSTCSFLTNDLITLP